jgi:hypothetical protein
VDGTGSGSCPVAGFGIRGFEPSGSATRELVNCFINLSVSQPVNYSCVNSVRHFRVTGKSTILMR